MRRLLGLTGLLLGLASALGAQDLVRVTHRFDLRRSLDQKYQGLVYGYLTGAWRLTPSATVPGSTEVEARYEIAQESRRNNALLEKPLAGERTSRFTLDAQGRMGPVQGDSVPYYRNFPAPLPPDVGPGSVWTGDGEVVADFLGTGTATRVPLLVEYRYLGSGDFAGTPVVQVKTQYALRYQAGQDRGGDPTLARAVGSRSGVVSYDASSHRVLFLRETTQEQFTSTAGTTLGNEGILLTFYEGVPALGVPQVVENLNKAVALSAGQGGARLDGQNPDVTIEADPRGVKLTLDNLNFVADQAVLLPGEDQRLARIADLLKTVPGRNLLVIGHTAAIGSQQSQDQLSVDRALSIVAKLKAAGVPAGSFLYSGRGGREPVASNGTEEGRAKNRRVEIVILDQ